ncbi:MAG: hypothetical protein CMF67_13230 [Magnetovibrio sp.]|nr:hypothetical protein [Magnetovibrio sp.]
MVQEGNSQVETLCALFVTAISVKFCKFIGGWAGPSAIELETFKVYRVTLSAMLYPRSKSGQKTLANHLQELLQLVWAKINLVPNPRVGDPLVVI